MRKQIIFLLLIILVGNIIIANGTTDILKKDETKIDPKIIEIIERNKKIEIGTLSYPKNETKIKTIVQLKREENNKGEKLSPYEKESRNEVISSNNLENKVKHKFSYINAFSLELTGEEIYRLTLEEEIEKIHYDYPIKAFLQESVPLINANSSWVLQSSEINLTGEKQTVCVIDTGVDFTHSDLQGKNLTCNIDCTQTNCPSNCSVLDDEGHGTHVAGIVGANGEIKGVAPDVKIIGIKALDATGSGSSGDVIKGIEWCVENSEEYNISVISMSLGAELYENNCDGTLGNRNIFFDPINLASEKNISVVVATGNDKSTTQISSPACISSAIPVGMSIDKNQTEINWEEGCSDNPAIVDTLSCKGNRNGILKIVAPGVITNSTTPDNSYNSYGGTSMATPHVSGAIAIIRQYLDSVNITKTPKEIEDVLFETGKVIYDLSSNENYSRIDVYSALMNLDVTPPKVNSSNIENDTKTFETNQTFNCSTRDWQLKNLTFFLWNSSYDLINESTMTISGTENKSSWFIENLSEGRYYWACNSSDRNENIGSTEIQTFYISEIFLEMSPLNQSYTNLNETEFICNVSLSKTELKNISFFLWNSSNSLLKNEILSISGTQNISLFNFTFEKDGIYSWNCEVFTEDNISTSENYTFNYDTTPPKLNGTIQITKTHDSATIYFNTNEETNSSLELIGKEKQYLVEFTLNKTFMFSELSASTNYQANVTFCDRAGNCNSSEIEFMTDTTPLIRSSGGGGSSTSKISEPELINIENESLIIEKQISLKKQDKICFKVSNVSHSIEIREIETNSIEVTIKSSPLNLTLFVGTEKKINLSSNVSYDFLIRLDSIGKETIIITIKEINESIMKEEKEVHIFEKNEELAESPTELNKNLIKDIVTILSTLIISIILISWIFNRKKKEGKERKKQKASSSFFKDNSK